MPQVIQPVLEPPDGEFLAQYFCTPIVTPTPVATRLPVPESDRDTVNGFVRVEAGGGSKCEPLTPNPWFDVTMLIHGYSPNEIEALSVANKCIGHMSAARGHSVAGWYVVRVIHVVLAHRLTDPMVNLPRYRGAVTWTVAGRPFS